MEHQSSGPSLQLVAFNLLNPCSQALIVLHPRTSLLRRWYFTQGYCLSDLDQDQNL